MIGFRQWWFLRVGLQLSRLGNPPVSATTSPTAALSLGQCVILPKERELIFGLRPSDLGWRWSACWVQVAGLLSWGLRGEDVEDCQVARDPTIELVVWSGSTSSYVCHVISRSNTVQHIYIYIQIIYIYRGRGGECFRVSLARQPSEIRFYLHPHPRPRKLPPSPP